MGQSTNKKLITAKKSKAAHRKADSGPASDLIPHHRDTDQTETQKIETEREEKEKAPAQRVRNQRRRARAQKRLQVWTPIILSALVFFVTSVYTFFSYQQWQTMDQQWQTMEKSLQVAQRAYVVISDIQPDFKVGQIRVLFENIGHVPAGNVVIRVDVERDAEGHPPEALPLEWNSHSFGNFSQIPPSGFKTVVDIPLQNFAQEDADLISAGKQVLWLSFWLRYDNGFESREKDVEIFGGTGGSMKTELSFRYFPPPHERWENISPFSHEDIRKRHEDERKKNEGTGNRN